MFLSRRAAPSADSSPTRTTARDTAADGPSRRPAPGSALARRAAARSGSVLALAWLLAVGLAPAAAARELSPAVGGPTAASTVTDATATVLEGIDVSHWQGTITWSKVAAAGKKFAIIKATESTTYVDPVYATNHAAAKAAGLWTGAYHFARPSLAANDAILEADHFAAVANLGVGDLIPALDLEDAGGLSVANLQTWVTTFLGEVTAKVGIRPMIYTSPSFWSKYMGNSRALADAGYKTLWVAHWGVTSPTVPASNWGGHGWTFWQYTSDGSVPGITGRVDLDRFNGSDLAQQAYSIFKLAAGPSASVKQGLSSAATVSILRTNFPMDVALDVTGMPAGTTASFSANPAPGSSAALTVTTPSDPAATPTGTYPLKITGVANGLTRTLTLNLVVADGIPPTVGPPVTRLFTGRTLGTTTVPVRVSWAATDPSGVASAGLQRKVNTGTWASVGVSPVTATSVYDSATNGAWVGWRSRATDRLANVSPWVAGPLVKASIFQQTSSTVHWSGTWHTVNSASASGGSLRYSIASGASVTFAFNGSSVAWVSARGPGRGSAKVYVDGVYKSTVNLSASNGSSRAIVYAANWGVYGSHTIKIVVVATAGHPRVDVDAFVRLAVS